MGRRRGSGASRYWDWMRGAEMDQLVTTREGGPREVFAKADGPTVRLEGVTPAPWTRRMRFSDDKSR